MGEVGKTGQGSSWGERIHSRTRRILCFRFDQPFSQFQRRIENDAQIIGGEFIVLEILVARTNAIEGHRGTFEGLQILLERCLVLRPLIEVSLPDKSNSIFWVGFHHLHIVISKMNPPTEADFPEIEEADLRTSDKTRLLYISLTSGSRTRGGNK